MTFEKMQTRILNPILIQRHVRWGSVARTRKMCVCSAFGEVFCLHSPSRARHSLMSVREMFLRKQSDWVAEKFAKWLGGLRHLHSFVPFLPSLPILSFLHWCRSCHCGVLHQDVEDENDAAIHKSLDNFDSATAALNVAVRRMGRCRYRHFAGM